VQIPKHLFDHQLGAAVGVGRRGRKVFPNRQTGRVAVHGRRRTEHQIAHAGLQHRLAQHERAEHVVAIVLERQLDRLPDRLVPGEMDHRTDIVLGKQAGQQLGIGDIALHHRNGSAKNALNAAHRLRRAIAEVVQHQHRIARLDELDTGMRTNVTGAAGHQNCFAHGQIVPTFRCARW
jgi:hypothetical protein